MREEDAAVNALDRRDLLGVLYPNPTDCLFVTGLAGAARDVAALTGDGPNLFALGGVMGAATMIGLGVSLAAPACDVVVVTGDGELLMNVGSLVTIANAAPLNLTIVCLDNSRHGETGNQPGHTGKQTSIEGMARGAGFTRTLSIDRRDALQDAADFVSQRGVPRLLVVKISGGPPSAYARMMDPAAVRLRARGHFMWASQGCSAQPRFAATPRSGG